jgi:flagellar basal-body rod modification protein FlgD
MAFDVPAIPNNSAFPSSVVDASTLNGRMPTKALDQQDFLKLLVAQITTQDPLNPKSDIEMIPQMVSFSTLAQSQSMQSDIALLRTEQATLRASALLGLTVQLQADSQTQVVGTVSAVQMVEGTPKLVVNGHAYGLEQVISVMPPPPAVVTPAPSNPPPPSSPAPTTTTP